MPALLPARQDRRAARLDRAHAERRSPARSGGSRRPGCSTSTPSSCTSRRPGRRSPRPRRVAAPERDRHRGRLSDLSRRRGRAAALRRQRDRASAQRRPSPGPAARRPVVRSSERGTASVGRPGPALIATIAGSPLGLAQIGDASPAGRQHRGRPRDAGPRARAARGQGDDERPAARGHRRSGRPGRRAGCRGRGRPPCRSRRRSRCDGAPGRVIWSSIARRSAARSPPQRPSAPAACRGCR